MAESMLRVEGLKTSIDLGHAHLRAVDGIDLDLRHGETLAVVGESGCGKSMAALSILRLLPDAAQIDSGSAVLGGSDVLRLPESAMRDVRGRRIGIVFQEPGTSLNPVMTVGAQISEVLNRHSPRSGDAGKRVMELLADVGIPEPARRIGEYPFQLSGGMKQRVMIAMALAADPDVLIADEPTTALDVTIQAQVLDLLRDLQTRRGMSILLITHDLGIVARMAHRVAVMYAGQIVEIADRERFFGSPSHPYSRKLFAALPGPESRGQLAVIRGQVPALTRSFSECRFADRCDFAAAACRDGEPRLLPVDANSPDAHRVRCVMLASGIDMSASAPPIDSGQLDASSSASASAVLEVKDLAVHFPIRKGLLARTRGSVKAVDGVSFELHAGKTLALVGESGCGKTTVGKSILRLVEPTAGSVLFEGVDLISLSERDMRRRRSDLQIIFQDPYASLNPRMRIAEILGEGIATLDHTASRTGLEGRIGELLDQVGLPQEAGRRYPHEFSGGQRQRIAIARALAVRPRLIVCDEPTSALDVSVQAQILNLLRTLQRELGLSYLFITHNIAVVEYLAHEVAVMYLGRIVEKGAAGDILKNPRHPYTRGLLASVPRIDHEAVSAQPPGVLPRISGEMPSAVHPPAGCHFMQRCPDAKAECGQAYPAVRRLMDGREVRCIRVQE